MSTITVPLLDDDIAFLRESSAAQGTSAEAFLAPQGRNLREHFQSPLQPEVMMATGIIPLEVAGQEAHHEHLEKKHARSHPGHQHLAGCVPKARTSLGGVSAGGEHGYCGDIGGICPVHGPTTHYLISCATRIQTGHRCRDGSVLRHFQIGNPEAAGWQDARRLTLSDFEDGGVAVVARATASVFIIARNVDDFVGSPVCAIAPADFLSQLTTAVEVQRGHDGVDPPDPKAQPASRPARRSLAAV